MTGIQLTVICECMGVKDDLKARSRVALILPPCASHGTNGISGFRPSQTIRFSDNTRCIDAFSSRGLYAT